MTHPAVMATKILPPFCFDQDQKKKIVELKSEGVNWEIGWPKKDDGVEGDGKQERGKLGGGEIKNYP